MSEKQFKNALERVRAGHIEDALSILNTLDRGFVNKRLAHYKTQPDQREPAPRLETALRAQEAGRRRSAPPPAPSFSAPLPPAVAALPPLRTIAFDEPEPFLLWACADWDTVPTLDLDHLTYTDV